MGNKDILITPPERRKPFDPTRWETAENLFFYSQDPDPILGSEANLLKYRIQMLILKPLINNRKRKQLGVRNMSQFKI